MHLGVNLPRASVLPKFKPDPGILKTFGPSERPSCGGFMATAETTLFPTYSARLRRLLTSSARLDNEPIWPTIGPRGLKIGSGAERKPLPTIAKIGADQ
jgi:hypothetical protein